ncbi:hypothetical protein RB595_004996 [Gaeumannomyces hyphopodioides]
MVSGPDVLWTAADIVRLCAVGRSSSLRPGVGVGVDARRRSEDREGRVGRAAAVGAAAVPTVTAAGNIEVEVCGAGCGNLKLTVYDLARGSGRDNAPIGSGDGYVCGCADVCCGV